MLADPNADVQSHEAKFLSGSCEEHPHVDDSLLNGARIGKIVTRKMLFDCDSLVQTQKAYQQNMQVSFLN